MANKKKKPKRTKPHKTRKKVQGIRTGTTASTLYKKIDRLGGKIDLLRKQQEKTEDDVEESLKDADDVEEDVEGIEKDIDKVEKNVEKIEEEIVNIGKLSMKRRHFTELIRGVAGAFLGVGIGMGMRLVPIMAENIEWANAVGILVFIFMLGSMLIYKNEKDMVEKYGNMFVFKRLAILFLISLGVEIIALLLFNLMPANPELALKALIVGSYPAMSGAITFSIS